ncbi:hypothetical protein E2C01_068861 [Portunus trituberculatus]|uniref:Secreted protein n=1 Tax=Portunus trituberculatus TaxID=210409 RepID=A0A5B7HNI7_PORTR|nr:hypothetical protein [Portunus trituberculatus]
MVVVVVVVVVGVFSSPLCSFPHLLSNTVGGGQDVGLVNERTSAELFVPIVESGLWVERGGLKIRGER